MQLRTHFTKKEHSDSGLALLLITLMIGFWYNHQLASRLAIAEVLILLITPVLVFPFTFLWLNISELLGKVISKILLTIIFFVFVWPVALFRKAIGKDTLRLKGFKKNTSSVFNERNHTYSKTDFTTPY
jgi:Mn2+/Fe2+ NRAMP family transporter